MDLIKMIVAKIFSGKFILTAIGGVAFYYCVVNKLLTSEAIVGVLMYVFMSYFGKKDTPIETKTKTDNQ